MKNLNTGLNIEKERLAQNGTEFLFGGFSQPCLASIPENEREQYLPKGERQDIGEEKMWCATASPLNLLEVKFNWLLKNKKILPENERWLRDNGYITENGFEFSDAFIAILSGTDRSGNSLKAPLDAIRKNGLIPKNKLPQLNGFDENYNPNRITGSLKALGQQFLQRFKFNYEKVSEIHYKELLKDDMLGVAGYAWPQPVNGEYPKTDLSPNHAFLVYKNEFFAFDNYEESQNDYIKKLSPQYNFLEYGYRLYISAQYLPSNKWWMAEILSNLWQLFFPIKEKVEELKITPKPMPKPDEPKYLWDTPQNVRLSLREIADEEGLTLLQKDLACDICYAESGYNPKAKLVNSVGSVDRGLFQINSYWHKHVTDEMAYNPEYNARWGCRGIKEGKAKTYWSASMKNWNKSGKYNDLIKS